MYRLTERTYANADGTQVVPEGSLEARYLVGLAGDEITEDEAKKLGLLDTDEAEPEEEAETEEEAEPASAEEQPKRGPGRPKRNP